ncbi:MAG: antibiotic biosynthesis monooxygenase family protein [Saprospiraceae bacterium]
MNKRITRIVKMEFESIHNKLFVEKFNQHALKMKAVPGCMSIELVKDIHTSSTTFFTISVWRHEADLNVYRESELFNLIWSELKPLFCAQPQAWTTQSIYHAKH